MRIRTVHINTQDDWRGGEQQTLFLTAGLLRRGHEAVLATRPESPLGRRAIEAGVPVFPIRPVSEIDPVAIAALVGLLRRFRPDVLHMHSPHALALGGLAARLGPRSLRRVVSRRVARTIYRRASLRLNWLKYRLGAERYIAVSAAVKEILVRDGMPDARVAVVHSGIDPSAPIDPPAEAATNGGRPRPLVVSVGALDARKGPLVLVEAAAAVLASRDADFVLVGEGPLAARLRERIAASGLGERVRLAGFQDRVQPWIEAADLYVQPSLSEGLGTSILDALSRRKPVIASRTGGIPEIIEDGRHGLLVPPGDAPALARAVLDLLADRPRGEALGARGRERVLDAFTADRMVERTLAVYVDLVEGGRR